MLPNLSQAIRKFLPSLGNSRTSMSTSTAAQAQNQKPDDQRKQKDKEETPTEALVQEKPKSTDKSKLPASLPQGTGSSFVQLLQILHHSKSVVRWLAKGTYHKAMSQNARSKLTRKGMVIDQRID